MRHTKLHKLTGFLFIWLKLRYIIRNTFDGSRMFLDNWCYIYIKVYQQCLYIKRRSIDSDWARRGAFSMYHTISFIVPSINFMASSVDSIVLTWFRNIYPAHHSNYHVCYKYKKAKAVQRYGYNAIACCNLKTEAVKTLPLSLYSIFEILLSL